MLFHRSPRFRANIRHLVDVKFRHSLHNTNANCSNKKYKYLAPCMAFTMHKGGPPFIGQWYDQLDFSSINLALLLTLQSSIYGAMLGCSFAFQLRGTYVSKANFGLLYAYPKSSTIISIQNSYYFALLSCKYFNVFKGSTIISYC